MKHVLKFQKLLVLTVISILVFACSKENITAPPDGTTGEIIETDGQITAEDFDEFAGEIGVVLDARPIARKGYKPTQVTININATSGNYTQTVPIDEFSFMGQLKIPLEGLSQEAKNELTSGVQITPEYKDANGNVIFTDATATVSFQPNPSARTANAIDLEETEDNQTITLSEDSSYYIQTMNDDGSPSNAAMRHLSGAGFSNVITANTTLFNGNETDRIFTFVPIPNEMNTYAIRLKTSGRFVQVSPVLINTTNFLGSHIGPNLTFLAHFTQVQNASNYNAYKFKIDKVDNGSYLIKTYDGISIKQIPGFGLTVSASAFNLRNFQTVNAEERLWRMVSTTVEWNVTNIGTSFLEPILPKPQTGFSFNSTLTNCGNGSLSQTVGANITETRSRTIGWEESLSVNTSNTVSVSATVEVGFEAGFFGVGGNFNLSVTAGYEHSWSSTSESSNWEDTTDEIQESLFTERTVTVPAGSASLVYDVFQFYPNTKVNFVQRLRVEGIDSETGVSLTGEEIKTQFYFNKFNGVITSIEPNSIVITLKGTVTLDKVIKTESDVQDVPANCN